MWNDLSLTLAPQELRALGEDETITDVRPPDLGDQFFEIASGGGDVIEALHQFASACCDALERLPAWERQAPRHRWLSEEANTWRLAHCLQLDKRTARPPELPEAFAPSHLIAALLSADRDLRRMQLVVDWLEACSRLQDETAPPVPRVGGSLHWENTLHHLQNGISHFDTSVGNSLITQFDPDAPNRQKKDIHVLDRQDDENLCRRLFKEIRCGRFEQAISLCVDSGQMWRGIVLQGHRLLDFPEQPQLDTTFPIIGNPYRDLWKWSCIKLLSDAKENAFFKAVLSAQCGYLPSLLPLCSDTWEDLLWAHLRVQIEYRVDQHLREHYNSVYISTNEQISQEIFDWIHNTSEMSMHQIFSCVKGLYKNKVETMYQEVQRQLVLERVDAMLVEASARIDRSDFDYVRFLAHFVIVLRQIGEESSREVGDSIVKSYVKKLISNAEKSNVNAELIAFYTSLLPPKIQVELYSELMWSIESDDDKFQVAEAGIKARLNISAAARETVRRGIKLLKDHIHDAPSAESFDKYKDIVERVTKSLDWFTYESDQIFDAVTASNAIIRMLIFRGDANSATAVLAQLTKLYPSNVIAKKITETSNALREHLCLKAYLEAINGYATWCRQHVTGRPKSPEPLGTECSFTDKVHYEQIKEQVRAQREQWATAGIHQANHTKQLLYNVLLFPQGWLVDDPSVKSTRDTGEEFAERDSQLGVLRKLCIPEIVLLLLKVLQTGNVKGHIEAIRLAEILASDNRKLYSLFRKVKLREVLHKIGESSLAVLDDNRDPWGFTSNVP